MKSEAIHEGNQLPKYLQSTTWYFISSILTKGIGFFLVPMYTRYLTPEEYGILSTFEAFGRVLPVFLSLYLDSAFSRFYYLEKEVGKDRISVLYSTHFWFILIWGTFASICVATIIYTFDDRIGVFGLLPIVLIVGVQLLNQLSVMVTMIWNANLLAKLLSIFQIITAIVGVALTAYWLAILDYGWISRIYALMVVAVIQLVILTLIAIKKKWLLLTFDKKVLKRSLEYAVPLIPNVAAGWVALFSDRLILAHYGMLDQVGVYSVAAQIVLILYIFNDSITKVQGPLSMSGLTKNIEEAKDRLRVFVQCYVGLIAIFGGLVVIFSREILIIVAPIEYSTAHYVIGILAGVYIFSGIYRVFTNVISFHNKTWIISAAAFIQAALNLFLNFTFIPIFGMYAAAAATLLSVFFYMLFIYIMSQKALYVDIDLFYVGSVLILFFISILSVKALDYFVRFDLYSIGIKMAIAGALVISILRMNSGYLWNRVIRRVVGRLI